MSFTLCGNDIRQYTIETENDVFQDAAADLSAMICDRCGTPFPKQGAHRILLTSKGAHGTTVTTTIENEDLIIRAADAASMKKAVLCFWMEEVYHKADTFDLPT
jgi:hypothetical protein